MDASQTAHRAMKIMDDKTLYVTRPDLPSLEEFLPSLENIWQSHHLTNGGPYHESFERALSGYLGVDHLSLFCNGTTALIIALQALQITGEVVTTPYSFPATAHSLLWNGIKPVFVDIDPSSLNLDPDKIEAAITPQTTAILPVHCYGQPCDVEKIQAIADTHNLRVVYDAAHAFGVKVNGNSVLDFGDLSVLSFHATKAFHTFEGGAIICPDAKTKLRIDRLKNFGFVDETTVIAPGINGKMSEFNASLGLLQLKYIDARFAARGEVANRYRQAFSDVQGIQVLVDAGASNDSYFPILVKDNFRVSRDQLYDILKCKDIHARKYFSPLLTEYPMYRDFPSADPQFLHHAIEASQQILCLPIYPSLAIEDQNRVIDVVRMV